MLALLLAAAGVVLLDQAAKQAILARRGGAEPERTGWWPRLRVVRNRGGSLGLAGNRTALVALWALMLGSLLALVQWGPLFQGEAARLGLGAALGGATGNLIDHLWRGGVVDFIDLRWWPVFNLADVAIVGGVAAALWFR